MATTTTPWEGASQAESSLHSKMTAALGNQAQVGDVAIDHVTGVVDVAVGLPTDLAGPELDIRYAWVRWNLESLISHAFGGGGLRLGQVDLV
jgi:hypothetical protein